MLYNKILKTPKNLRAAQYRIKKGAVGMAANKIKLTICGANYVVMSEESEEYIQELAARLDEDMNNLMSNMPSASVTAAAIVTALGYLDELKKAENGADNMRSQVHEYLEDASKARMEALDASRRLAALQKEVDSLKERIGEV